MQLIIRMEYLTHTIRYTLPSEVRVYVRHKELHSCQAANAAQVTHSKLTQVSLRGEGKI